MNRLEPLTPDLMAERHPLREQVAVESGASEPPTHVTAGDYRESVERKRVGDALCDRADSHQLQRPVGAHTQVAHELRRSVFGFVEEHRRGGIIHFGRFVQRLRPRVHAVVAAEFIQ